MPRIPMAEWQAEHLRLTVFQHGRVNPKPVDWWQQVAGTEPAEATMNLKRGSALVQGAFGPGQLLLRIEPDRIDWLFSPSEELELGAATGFPVLGPAVELTDLFSNLAEKWFDRDDLPQIERMAFGAVFLHPEEDRHSGYHRLPEYVPVRVDPETLDFLYQINLPVAWSSIEAEGLHLNRLSKWSVAAFRRITLDPAGNPAQPQPFPDMFALRAELDINTSPSLSEPIPQSRLVKVYRELVQAGLDIATDGVTPK